ncbi:MAG: hypothetical protein JXB60_08010 [Candidatus Cloacimonetes bacterium]|nr:hypothetical protein [Candidatus Cloacimonadota bacterium]
MATKKINDIIPLLGIGILGYVHEFMISNRPELLPTILFGLLLAKGIAKIFEK